MALFRTIKKLKAYTDSLNESVYNISEIHHLKHSFATEESLLSNLEKQAKEYMLKPNVDLNKISDLADSCYEKLLLIDSFDDFPKLTNNRSKNKQLMSCKKDNFLRPLEKITSPKIINDTDKQEETNNLYSTLLQKRRNQIKSLSTTCQNSSLFAKVFCVYLARSNYPKRNAFEILPQELESTFDLERKNAKHLVGVTIFDSVLV